jgi:redox-sensitive bicupin YhaK (pirin superfamily)
LGDKDLRLFQLWVFPNKANVTPRYDQMKLPLEKKNQLNQILSPSPDDAGVWIHQDAWFHLGTFDQGHTITHQLKRPATHGVYAFIVEGDFTINGQALNKRDGYGLWKLNELNIHADSDEARILLLEVPMM